MSEENPGVDLYREALHIIDSGTSIAKMREIVAHDGKARQETRRQSNPSACRQRKAICAAACCAINWVTKTAATRLVDMLMAKMHGEKFESEMLPTRVRAGADARAR